MDGSVVDGDVAGAVGVNEDAATDLGELIVFEVLLGRQGAGSDIEADVGGDAAVGIGARFVAGGDGLDDLEDAGVEVVGAVEACSVGGACGDDVVRGADDVVIAAVGEADDDIGERGFAGVGDAVAVTEDDGAGDRARFEGEAEDEIGDVAGDGGEIGAAVGGAVGVEGWGVGAAREGAVDDVEEDVGGGGNAVGDESAGGFGGGDAVFVDGAVFIEVDLDADASAGEAGFGAIANAIGEGSATDAAVVEDEAAEGVGGAGVAVAEDLGEVRRGAGDDGTGAAIFDGVGIGGRGGVVAEREGGVENDDGEGAVRETGEAVVADLAGGGRGQEGGAGGVEKLDGDIRDAILTAVLGAVAVVVIEDAATEGAVVVATEVEAFEFLTGEDIEGIGERGGGAGEADGEVWISGVVGEGVGAGGDEVGVLAVGVGDDGQVDGVAAGVGTDDADVDIGEAGL